MAQNQHFSHAAATSNGLWTGYPYVIQNQPYWQPQWQPNAHPHPHAYPWSYLGCSQWQAGQTHAYAASCATSQPGGVTLPKITQESFDAWLACEWFGVSLVTHTMVGEATKKGHGFRLTGDGKVYCGRCRETFATLEAAYVHMLGYTHHYYYIMHQSHRNLTTAKHQSHKSNGKKVENDNNKVPPPGIAAPPTKSTTQPSTEKPETSHNRDNKNCWKRDNDNAPAWAHTKKEDQSEPGHYVGEKVEDSDVPVATLPPLLKDVEDVKPQNQGISNDNNAEMGNSALNGNPNTTAAGAAAASKSLSDPANQNLSDKLDADQTQTANVAVCVGSPTSESGMSQVDFWGVASSQNEVLEDASEARTETTNTQPSVPKAEGCASEKHTNTEKVTQEDTSSSLEGNSPRSSTDVCSNEAGASDETNLNADPLSFETETSKPESGRSSKFSGSEVSLTLKKTSATIRRCGHHLQPQLGISLAGHEIQKAVTEHTKEGQNINQACVVSKQDRVTMENHNETQRFNAEYEGNDCDDATLSCLDLSELVAPQGIHRFAQDQQQSSNTNKSITAADGILEASSSEDKVLLQPEGRARNKVRHDRDAESTQRSPNLTVLENFARLMQACKETAGAADNCKRMSDADTHDCSKQKRQKTTVFNITLI